MTDNDRAVRGPMYVAATPLMVTADVEPLVHANVGELLDLLMSDEFFEDFTALACTEAATDHDGHTAQTLAFETLQAQLVERMSTRVTLTGPEAMRVAGRMAKLAKPLADLSASTAAKVSRGASLIKHPSHAKTRKHFAANPLPGQRSEGSAA